MLLVPDQWIPDNGQGVRSQFFNGKWVCKCKRFRYFDRRKDQFPNKIVGATANAIMAAVLAKGSSQIVNAAQEPEIIDLCNCLKSMGCQIDGAGENTIFIEGVKDLKQTTHKVLMDRIELGTYIIAGAISDGDIRLTGGNAALLTSFIKKLEEAGVEVLQASDWVRYVESTDHKL